MNNEKFFNYLFEYKNSWSITNKGIKYSSNQVKQIIEFNISEWNNKKIKFDRNKYVIAVGFDQLDYFIYLQLASAIGMKIILCDHRMLDILLANYNLPYEHIISTKNIRSQELNLLIVDKTKINADFHPIKVTPSQARIIFFTSGTTALPKLVLYQEKNLLKNAVCVSEYLNINSNDSCLIYFHTNYMYGFSMLMCSLVKSGAVIFERVTITANEIWNYLINDKITILPVIKRIVDDLLPLIDKNKNIFFKSLTIINASDKIYSYHVKKLLNISPIFSNNFGQTESGPRIFTLKLTNTMNNIDDYFHKGVLALGRPVDDLIDVSIVDSTKNKIDACNEIGELSYKSPYAMEGYINTEGNLIKVDRIFSGDLIYKDKEGCIFWVGRKDETTKINGVFVNIGLLHQYFDLLYFIDKSYFVISNRLNVIRGFFVAKDDFKHMTENFKDVIEKLYRTNFPKYPRIIDITFINELPTTLSGKIKITQLKNYVLQ